MPTEPKISVVVATFKRAPILARTLDHIVKQQYDPAAFEVIVVDDGSEDGTDAVVHAAAASAPVAIHYLSHENRGPGYTQNRGIRAARGEIVLLLADDIFLTPGALEAHMRRHDSYPDPRVAVLGNAVQSPELDGTGFLRRWDAFGMNRFDHLEELPYFLFWAFNLSFKREFMLSHGMFREALGRGGPPAHEDTELGYRLHRRGMVLLFAKEALGYHYHPSTLRQAARRYYERGLNYRFLSSGPSGVLVVQRPGTKFCLARLPARDAGIGVQPLDGSDHLAPVADARRSRRRACARHSGAALWAVSILSLPRRHRRCATSFFPIRPTFVD